MIKINTEFIKSENTLLNHKKCVFVIGAGVSVASGIPDFRSPNGIFATLRKDLKINGKELFSYEFGIKESSRKIYLKYISSLKRLCDGAQSNETHSFLTDFPRSRIYTQNIDGLEEKAGMQFSKTDSTKGVYLHGNLAVISCLYCGFKTPFESAEIKAFEEGEEITCKKCLERREHCLSTGMRKKPLGVMHPSIIHCQQSHPDGVFISRLCEKDLDCDLLIVIGTSLAIDGVKKLVRTFCRGPNAAGKRILVNLTKPNKEWETYFDYFFEGDCLDFVRAVNYNKIRKMNIDSIRNNGLAEKGKCVLAGKSKNNTNLVGRCGTIGGVNIDSVGERKTEIDERIHLISSTIDTEKEDFSVSIDTQIRRLSISKETDEFNYEKMSAKESENSFENKLKILTKSFSDEETIDSHVLDEVIRSTVQTEIDSSFCSSLQSEIEEIVKETKIYK